MTNNSHPLERVNLHRLKRVTTGDTTKYGGYSSLNISHFALVEIPKNAEVKDA